MSDKDDSKISGALQENVLTLLCFDDKRCHHIRAAVGSARIFENSVFKEVAGHAIDFIDQFGEAIKEHLADQLEGVLKGDDSRKASIYARLLENMYSAKEGLNGEYVISQLNKFVRQQHLKSAVISAVECLEDGRVDQAEVELQKGLGAQSTSFEIGTNLGDPTRALAFLDEEDQCLLTGIEGLDKMGIGPRRKELFLVMAPPGRGKTWALIHLGKWALLQRQTVVHITLEMSEARTSQRYLQSFFSIAKKDALARIPTFTKDDKGRMTDVFYEEVERTTLNDPNIRTRLTNRIKRVFHRQPPLIIKQFPTGGLTMAGLKAYLDGLERYHKIIPDMLIIDYPDLMTLDTANIRADTGKLMKDLRGIGVERNMAVVGATQSNREGSRARIVDESMVAEDWSKIMIADNIISYNQTAAEKALGLARLFSVKARNDESQFATIISQNYGIGQFCLDSASIQADYWQYLEGRQVRAPGSSD